MTAMRHVPPIFTLTILAVLSSTATAAGPETLENPLLRVTVDPQAGTLGVLDKVSGQQWFSAHARKPGDAPRFRNLSRLPGADAAVRFEADFGATDGRPNTLQVTLRLPPEAGDLLVEADMADRDTRIKPFAFLDPLVTDSAENALVVADYSNGHIYPANTKKPVRSHFATSRMDMPWIGVCDLARGTGYLVLIETSDDGAVTCPSHTAAGRDFAAPQVQWGPSQDKFAYARKLLYHFAPRGGYVALAKRYRAYACEQGLLVPLSEKVKKNPNLPRLFGAPDVWGDASLRFAREAKAAGVDKMLIHGRPSPADMKAVNELGYLTSEYDNYTDVLPIEPTRGIDSSHDRIPESVVLKADGQRMTAWLTFDKKQQYMKRCPALWGETAKQVVPKLLAEHPYLGRFVDVTTAEDLYECYDPLHPLTRGQKRQCGVELLAFMRSQGLVVGGEHGIWWGVPQQDYIEGMMSGGYYSWPAGHLLRPKTKADQFDGPWGNKYGAFETYEQWGIGHASRLPLWELVFHDCVVSTWYWGDASDFLLAAAPEITPKKDACNILYGTIPLLWASREGSWHTARDVFLRTYRNTCKLHEVIAGAELLSHEWLTEDRAVQRTRFSDGTEATVNFGAQPHAVTVAGNSYLLPQNGFAVKGPKIEQSLVLDGRRAVTTIRTADYFFSDAQGVDLSMRRDGSERVSVQLGAGETPVLLPLASFVPGWDGTSTRLYQLNDKGERTRLVASQPRDGGLAVGPFAQPAMIEALCGSKTHLPDLVAEAADLSATPERTKQGQPLNVAASVRNVGNASADNVEVVCYVDEVRPDRKLAGQGVSLAAGTTQVVRFAVDTAGLDGSRELIVAIDPDAKVKELCAANNIARRTVDITADYTRWPHRRKLVVEAGPMDRDGQPVVVPADLAGADPASVRVVSSDSPGGMPTPVPAQLDVVEGKPAELCLLFEGKTPSGASRRFTVLWADRPADGKPGLVLAPRAGLWHSESATITAETYRVRLEDGALVDLAARHGDQADTAFLSKLIISSSHTGWTDEPGTVGRCEVLAAGPARVVIAVRKALKDEVVYEKTYTFYSRRFDVQTSVNKYAGTLSRAYYVQTGQYVDNGGLRAVVDGRGDGEGVIGKNRKPLWYAVYADRWAHACVGLSTFHGITYWDAGGNWGGIGLDTSDRQGVRMSYVIHPGAKDAEFAETDYRQLADPPKARWE
ncbi:MAG: hypothetical protein HUU20_21035 [Pirellulales bacterium]|nr:hypothetical protein [Pirellulales bacterium]